MSVTLDTTVFTDSRFDLLGRLLRVREIPIDRHCPVFDQNRSSSMLFSNILNMKPEGICSPA